MDTCGFHSNNNNAASAPYKPQLTVICGPGLLEFLSLEQAVVCKIFSVKQG
jgi:hypothetical protein